MNKDFADWLASKMSTNRTSDLDLLRLLKLRPEHFYEIFDRSYVIADLWERVIVDHPATEQTPELRNRAKKILDLLFEFYGVASEQTFLKKESWVVKVKFQERKRMRELLKRARYALICSKKKRKKRLRKSRRRR